MNSNIDLTTDIAGIRLKTPVVTASGTFGYGDEISDLVDLGRVGGIVTKTITRKPKPGNPPPRIAEVTGGMLNTIGLQNVGVEKFLSDKWASLRTLPAPVVISIAGETADDYVAVAEQLDAAGGMAGIELNLSCPNLQKQIICQNTELVGEIVSRVKKASRVPVIAKLSPMVVDLPGLCLFAQNAGADALSLVNTFPGMAVDIRTWKPRLAVVSGGMSGPAIKPLALRCVWEAAKKVRIPIIGGGGIMTWEDAVEFLLAGATAVSVGTASFIDPQAPVKVAEGIAEYLRSRDLSSPRDLTGKIRI